MSQFISSLSGHIYSLNLRSSFCFQVLFVGVFLLLPPQTGLAQNEPKELEAEAMRGRKVCRARCVDVRHYGATERHANLRPAVEPATASPRHVPLTRAEDGEVPGTNQAGLHSRVTLEGVTVRQEWAPDLH